MKYGYARVSSAGQARYGTSLEDQKNQLTEAGAEEVMSDVYTGTKKDRPAFTELLGRLQPGDTLIVCKIDRFARSVADGATVIRDLIDRGITVHVLNMNLTVDNSPMNKAMVTMLLMFAELERDLIAQRTWEGKECSGNYGGRKKKYTPKQIALAHKLLSEGNSYKQVEQMTGISKSTLIRSRDAEQGEDEE